MSLSAEMLEREELAAEEDARHGQRMIGISILALFVTYLSGRYAATRRKEIMYAALPPRRP